ncbi:hypothetical protein SNOUR_01985 [Streptomyces noursei ATCC 11455]|nr:hypothetical protein SNOUR_01985 [Streptomyces noursei ATCC 11455]
MTTVTTRTVAYPAPDRIAGIGYGTGGAVVLELGRDGVDLLAERLPVTE